MSDAWRCWRDEASPGVRGTAPIACEGRGSQPPTARETGRPSRAKRRTSTTRPKTVRTITAADDSPHRSRRRAAFQFRVFRPGTRYLRITGARHPQSSGPALWRPGPLSRHSLAAGRPRPARRATDSPPLSPARSERARPRPLPKRSNPHNRCFMVCCFPLSV